MADSVGRKAKERSQQLDKVIGTGGGSLVALTDVKKRDKGRE